jgi:hypothetical protein
MASVDESGDLTVHFQTDEVPWSDVLDVLFVKGSSTEKQFLGTDIVHLVGG